MKVGSGDTGGMFFTDQNTLDRTETGRGLCSGLGSPGESMDPDSNSLRLTINFFLKRFSLMDKSW